MVETAKRHDVKCRFKHIFGQLSYIQIRIKAQLATREGKIDVLMHYWDKLFHEVQKRAAANKDSKSMELLRQLIMVPERIRYAMAKVYV